MDVWDLPPIEAGNNPCPTPVEEQSHTNQHGSWVWVTDPVAIKPHSCRYCTNGIGIGDPYHREAIPLHTKVLVFKTCKGCL